MKKMSYPRFLARAAMTLLAVFCFLGARAQTTVEIGDGTATSNTNPIGTYYNYSITEQLYTADEIGMAGTITSISFYYMGIAAKDLPITVYMANVDAADLSTGISLADADEVFSGTLSVTTTAGWVTIDLDTPFAYDGTSNLLIGFNKDYVYYFSGQSWQGTATTSTMARYTQNDDNAYDTSTVPGTATNKRPNIQIGITPGGDVQICPKPSTFVVSDITTTGASFEWEDTGAGSYSFEYKKASDTEWTAVSVEGVGRGDASIKTYTLSDLDPGTSYNARVKAICGEDSESGYKTLNFTTSFGIPLVEEFGTSIPTGWAIYSGLLDDVMAGAELATATYGWSFGSNNGVFDNHARVNIYGTSCKYWLVTPTLLMENNVQLMFNVAYTAYSGSGGAPAQTGSDDKFVVLINNGNGWTILRQWDNAGSEYVLNDLNATPATVTLDLSSYAGQSIAIAFYGESTEGNADNNLHIDNVSIDYIPACPKPTGLAVNYEGGTEATVTWEGDASAYNIDYNETQVTGITGNSYKLTGLELGTTYEVKVQADCGDSQSEWTAPVSFTTDNCMPEDMCSLTFDLADSYGDGWNGSYIAIYDYTGEEIGDLLASVTLSSGASSTQTLSFCTGQELALIWISGSQWDSEASYTITDINGDIVAQDDTDLEMAYTIDCTVTDCRRPTNFTASKIGSRSVELSWTENGEATAWEIAYMADNDEEITTITVESNPYTLTGLNPETTYYAQVTPVCEVDKPSEVISWTTDTATPAPKDLAVSKVTTTSAEVSWAADAEATGAVLEYANAEGVSISSAEYKYDNGTYATAIGLGGGAFKWGVMFPAGSYTGNSLTKVSVYDQVQMTGSVTIYNDGDTAPKNPVASVPVTFTGAGAFIDIEIGADIDATKNVWVIFYNESGEDYPAATSEDELGDANGRWVEIDGTWYDMANVGVTGRCFMVRAEIANVDLSSLSWTTVADATSPYEITGLTPETSYVVRVKSIYADGESQWVNKFFTTKVGTEVPIDLAAETTSTTATLSWTGYQESYNVKYREALEIDPTTPATIILTAPDIWGDGSGYQMLLDADATAYGTIIPETGGLTTSGDASADTYAEFEYKIPENADGALTTENVVVNNSVSIEIPAGTYDWCITNPTAGDRVWIAASNGVGGRYDDFVFEPGVTYEFTLSTYGSNDGVDLTVTRPMGDWITVENVTNPYELTGLTPDTYYEWQVQGIYEGDPTEWSEIATFTTLPLIVLANDDSNNEKKNSEIIADYDGETVDVTLAGRTLFKDDSWNTLCLPFDVTLEGSPLEGATAKTLDSATMTGNHVSLTFGSAVDKLKAGVPYIIKWTEGEDISEPTFTGVNIEKETKPYDDEANVKFIGYYDAKLITPNDDANIYYMTADNTLKYTGVNRTLKSCRAYFEFSESAVRGFTLNFGDNDATGIVSIDNEQLNNESGWYTVDGKKLDKQPKRKGVYINNGIKVVIK